MAETTVITTEGGEGGSESAMAVHAAEREAETARHESEEAQDAAECATEEAEHAEEHAGESQEAAAVSASAAAISVEAAHASSDAAEQVQQAVDSIPERIQEGLADSGQEPVTEPETIEALPEDEPPQPKEPWYVKCLGGSGGIYREQ